MEKTQQASQEDQILSKELKVDANLKLSNQLRNNTDSDHNNNTDSVKLIIANSIQSVDLQNTQEKLGVLSNPISCPNNYVFASLIYGIYEPDEKLYLNKDNEDLHGKKVLPEIGNWQLLTVGYNSFKSIGKDQGTVAALKSVCTGILFGGDRPNGYCGAAYWNPDTQQVIIVHSGTKNTGGLDADLLGVFLNAHVAQIDSAITFTDMITSILKEINKEKGTNIQLYITGHSLGAWLAPVTAFSAKYLKKRGNFFDKNPEFEKNGYHTRTVIFDGPGCEEALRRIQKSVMNHYGPSFINSLDVINYLTVPNLINACNSQVGEVYKLFIQISQEDRNLLESMKNKNIIGELIENVIKKRLIMHTVITHKIKTIKDVFDPETGEDLKDQENLRIHKVVDWPLLISVDKKEEVRSMSIKGVKWFLKIPLIIGHLAFKVLAKSLPVVGAAIDIADGAYGIYKTAKWYNELMQELSAFHKLADDSNNYHLNEDPLCCDFGGREIRYKTIPLDKDYKNKRSLNVFTSAERKFLEEYKFLEGYQEELLEIVNLEEIFETFKGDEMIIKDMMEKLKGCTVENETIHSTKLQEFIPFIKCMLHLFPEMKQKVTKMYCELPSVIHNKLYRLISSSYLNIIKSSLDFGRDHLGLTDFLEDSNLKVLLTNVSKISLGTVRIYKTFNLFENHYKDEKHHAFLTFDKIFYLGEDMFMNFLKKVNYQFLLVVECNDVLSDKTERFFEKLLQNFHENHNAKYLKLVLVIQKGSELSKFITDKMIKSNLECRIENSEIEWDDLTSDSQKRLLNKAVIFQGKELSLRNLMNGVSDCTMINTETIIKLFANKKIEIGRPLPSLGEIENYYIDRKFIKKIKVRNEILKDGNLSDIFAVSNISKDTLSNLVIGGRVRDFGEINSDENNFGRFFILKANAEESNFNSLCIEHSNCTIHWLRKHHNGDLIWQKSYGENLSGLRSYLENNENDLSQDKCSEDNASIKIVDVDDISKFDEMLVVIAAEPGMGKTTALTRLGTQEKDDSKWLIRLNLVEIKDKLEHNNFNETSSIVTLLHENNIVRNAFENKLLESRLFKNGNIVFLLDGFDEISSESQKNVINLIKKLRETKTDKILITTRLHLRNELENSLSTVAYTLKPFFRDDQKQFLRKFWLRNLHPSISTASLDRYIDKLLKFISQSIGDKERKFMGIPMQMRMVAEAFQEITKNQERLNHPECTFPENFDMLRLYDRFVNAKYLVYFSKIGGGAINLNKESRKDMLTAGMKVKHEELAFKELFFNSGIDVNCFLEERSISEEEKQEINLVGIAQFIDERIAFTHRTFGEYFAANFLAEKLNVKKRNKQMYETTLELLAKELFKSKHEVIRTFLDYRLAREKIHLAILKGNLNEVQQYLREDKENIRVTDILGRNALHYAAQEEEIKIVDALQKEGANIMSDELGKNAFHYASRYNRGTRVISCLLKNYKDFMNNKDHNGRTAVYYAAEQGNWDIVDIILEEEGADMEGLDKEKLLFHYTHKGNLEKVRDLLEAHEKDINLVKDIHDNTLLHIAAQKGHLTTGEFLMEKGADVSHSNNRGLRPIMYAAEGEHWLMVESLLRKKAKLNDLSDRHKSSLLCHSAQKAHWDIVKLFIEDNGKDMCYAYLDCLQRVKLLFYLVRSETFDPAEFLIRKGTAVNCFDNNGKRLIHYASENGHWNFVRILLRNNANFNDLENTQKISLLHYSAENYDWDIIKLFMEDNNRSNYIHNLSKEQQIELLCYLIDSDQLDMTKFLIKKGTESDSFDRKGKKPINYACENRHWNIVELLVRKKTNFDDLEGTERDLLLSYSSENSHWSTVQLFMKNNYIDIYFDRLNDQQQVDFLCSLIRCGNFDMTKLIIERGVQTDICDSNNKTPVSYAVASEHWNIVEYLLKYNKANFPILEKAERESLLCYSSKNSNWDIIKFFLEDNNRCDYLIRLEKQQRLNCLYYFISAGDLIITMFIIDHLLREEEISSINLSNSHGETFLHFASKNGKLDIVQYLVKEKGADITVVREDKKTPKDLASEGGYTNVVEFFELEQRQVFLKAMEIGDLDLTEILINQGVNVDVRYKNNLTPLHLAISFRTLEVVKYFLKKGADVAAKNDHDTALHLAIKRNNEDIIMLILDEIKKIPGSVNQCIDAKDSEGDTPLIWAAEGGKENAVQMLLDNGASTKLKNNNGMTALHLTAKNGHSDVAKLLIDNGCDIHVMDDIGRKPMHIAALHGHKKVIEVFLSKGANINDTDKDGYAPLHYAACRNFEIFNFVLNCEADINAKGKSGRTALDLGMAMKKLTNAQASNEVMRIDGPNSLPHLTIDEDSECEYLKEFYNQGFQLPSCSLKQFFQFGKEKYDKGRYKDALKCFEFTYFFQIRTDSIGANHPDTLVTRMFMAIVSSKLGNYGKALEILSEVCDLQEQSKDLGPDHPSTLCTRHNIAEVNYKLGKYETALKLYEEVLAKRKEVLEPNHPDILITRHHIARVRNNQGDHITALNMFYEIFDIQREVLGTNHPNTLKTQHNIAFTLYWIGQCPLAYSIITEVSSKSLDVLGHDHPDYLTTVHITAILKREFFDYEGALILLKNIVQIQEKVLGLDHTDTLAARHDIASVLQCQGKKQEAARIFREVYEKRKEVLGPDHLYTSYYHHYIRTSDKRCIIQ